MRRLWPVVALVMVFAPGVAAQEASPAPELSPPPDLSGLRVIDPEDWVPTLSTTDVDGRPASVFGAGDTFGVSGSGFPPNTGLRLEIEQPFSVTAVGSALSDSTGAFQRQVLAIPLDASKGPAFIRARGAGVVARQSLDISREATTSTSTVGLVLWGVLLVVSAGVITWGWLRRRTERDDDDGGPRPVGFTELEPPATPTPLTLRAADRRPARPVARPAEPDEPEDRVEPIVPSPTQVESEFATSRLVRRLQDRVTVWSEDTFEDGDDDVGERPEAAPTSIW